MIVKGNRQEEILARARNRTVVAFVQMSAPQAEPGMLASNFGMIVEDRRPLHALTASPPAQGSHVWIQDDTCVPLADKKPEILHSVLEAVARRTRTLESGELANLAVDEKRAVFDSADLVERATGIPRSLSISFGNAAQDAKPRILTLPFPRLQDFLLRLDDKLHQIGGTLNSVTVEHKSQMTSFEFYEQATKKFMPGRRFCFGDVMLARAHNLLAATGMPLIPPPKSRLN